MATNENDTELTWTSKREWGSDGLTHRAKSGDWSFEVLLPQKGRPWRVTGWKNGTYAFFSESKTMRGAKQLAAEKISRGCPECGRDSGHKLDCSKRWN